MKQNILMKNSKNKIALMIKGFGMFELICGAICAFWFSGYYERTSRYGVSIKWEPLHNPSVFFTWILAAFISWLVLTGFAEIIQILHDIRENQNK